MPEKADYIIFPDYWSPVSKTGTHILKWEETAPFCGKDKRSIYICNPTNADMGVWNYKEKVAIKGGAGYTLITLRSKIPKYV